MLFFPLCQSLKYFKTVFTFCFRLCSIVKLFNFLFQKRFNFTSDNFCAVTWFLWSVSWTLVPKTPGARHSQGFSSTKWGSGSLNRFCTVYRVLLSQEIKVFSKFVPTFGAISLLILVIVTRCRPKAFAGAVRHSVTLEVQHWALLRGRECCVCRPPFLCAHPGTPRDTQGVSEAWESRISQEKCLPSGTQMSLGQIKLSRNYLFLLPAYCLLLALARTYKGTVWMSVFSPALESIFCFCLPKWISSLQCKGLAQL